MTFNSPNSDLGREGHICPLLVLSTLEGHICPLVILTFEGHICPLLILTFKGHICPLLILTLKGHICSLLILTLERHICPLLILTLEGHIYPLVNHFHLTPRGTSANAKWVCFWIRDIRQYKVCPRVKNMAFSGVFPNPPHSGPLQRRSTLDSRGAFTPRPFLFDHIVPRLKWLKWPSSYGHNWYEQ